MINLKKEEEYQNIYNMILNACLNRKCYKCGSKTKKLKDYNMIICTFFACKEIFSYLKNTFFENSKLPLLTIIKVVYM